MATTSLTPAAAGSSHAEPAGARGVGAAVALGALGVVYGDIGTSPLYALREAVKAAGAGPPTAAAVIGAVSIILWSLILIVALKYATLILQADNRGEGGIVAMLALLHARDAKPGSWRAALLVVGLVGAALLYGDGAITPAISVLSAVEGLKVDAPHLTRLVVPLTIGILVGLFLIQHHGTGFIGRVFGPIMLIWFAALAVLGVGGIVRAPAILAALDPLRAVAFARSAGLGVTFAVLGAAFLAVTGGEAMYADLGHFGRRAIRLAWFVVVLPALVLNYLGQGALLLADPAAISNPFYQLAPDWAHYPLVAFATAATVIASQAIISGAFSLTQQATQLGFLPRLGLRHTSKDAIGQVYVPLVNWALAAATLTAVVAFGSSDALAGAYGVAVAALMVITTILAALVARQWGYNPVAIALVNGGFLVVDLVFLAANGAKLLQGGWFPLSIALVIALLMLTWRSGTRLVEAQRQKLRPTEAAFVADLTERPPLRPAMTGAFLTPSLDGIPLPLARVCVLTGAVPASVLLISIVTLDVPLVGEESRAELREVAAGIRRIVFRYGFTEVPDVPEALRAAAARGLLPGVDLGTLVYYLGRETVIASAEIVGMPVWRETLFSVIQRNAERTAAYFCIPAERVIEIGTEIEI
ncbi:MAG: potassium transporter Kup [Janthinobacterium lividum]